MTVRLIPAAAAVAHSCWLAAPAPTAAPATRAADEPHARLAQPPHKASARAAAQPTITLCDGLGRGYTVTGGPLTAPAVPGR